MDISKLAHHEPNDEDADNSFMTSFTTDNNDSEDDGGDPASADEDPIRYTNRSPSKHRQFFPLIGNMTFQPDFEDEDEHGQEFRNEIVTVEQDKSVAQNTSVPMVAPNDEDDIEDLDTEDDGDEQDLLPTRAPPRRTYEPDHQDEDEDEDEDEEIPDPVEQDDRVAQEESKPARARGKKKKRNNVTVADRGPDFCS
ncbi:hypothetical protein B0O80DRAFT_420924 [Mortierella sp. GBAus27b]|nr:hypothetical protein B0O80DRAFT_422991 [Mortierella sp. GBAus27b]KAI8363130.1 hypothetical protein B0O80DRAFT_420924 [Mortierella sp. GBAus27b]